MGHLPIEETEVFKRSKTLANTVWSHVVSWDSFAKQTVGHQFVRSSDSVCANLVEGDGRYTDPDAIKHFVIARGSCREAAYWAQVAFDRDLISAPAHDMYSNEFQAVRQMLNGLINYRRSTKNNNIVREPETPYAVDQESPMQHCEAQDSNPNASRRTPDARDSNPDASRLTPDAKDPRLTARSPGFEP